MKIATWNVSSVRVRLDRLLVWLKRTQPDIVCLQELKAREDAFPYEAIREAGYHAAVYGQRTFNGVGRSGGWFSLSPLRARTNSACPRYSLPAPRGVTSTTSPSPSAESRGGGGESNAGFRQALAIAASM